MCLGGNGLLALVWRNGTEGESGGLQPHPDTLGIMLVAGWRHNGNRNLDVA